MNKTESGGKDHAQHYSRSVIGPDLPPWFMQPELLGTTVSHRVFHFGVTAVNKETESPLSLSRIFFCHDKEMGKRKLECLETSATAPLGQHSFQARDDYSEEETAMSRPVGRQSPLGKEPECLGGLMTEREQMAHGTYTRVCLLSIFLVVLSFPGPGG